MGLNLLVGARTVMYLNGKPFAAVSNFNHTEDSPQKEVHGIDTLEPQELIPGPLTCSGMMTIYRQAHDGGIEGAGMMPTWQAATRGKYFSILIVDRITDTIIFESKKNSVIRQTWNIPTKGYVTGTIAFKGLLYGNNTESPT
jgi:hypothetical protein